MYQGQGVKGSVFFIPSLSARCAGGKISPPIEDRRLQIRRTHARVPIDAIDRLTGRYSRRCHADFASHVFGSEVVDTCVSSVLAVSSCLVLSCLVFLRLGFGLRIEGVWVLGLEVLGLDLRLRIWD
ncbi:hypothetical protein EYC84_000902 [Monilinia fructicola]|uniref:Uncharacterized protein n=1 Tax=Monilinia fructicola TaxID=38448 RepID=A0A5M9JQJ7_MONFR|nr:hypothetical protein EYC84_000902 [Monilinia fructicola]